MFSNATRLSERVYKVVEDDRFGQFPFMYVVMGVDKCIVIDTGVGTGNYRQFVDEAINKSRLPYLIINTHIHFDHVGGNHFFRETPNFRGICVGGNAQVFSENYPLNSLVLAHHGANLVPFTIDRWLQPGELIYLDDAHPTDDLALHVIYTPGHTPDSIALHFPAERRIFAGDTVYPWTVIHVDCLGSSPKDYLASTSLLLHVIASLPSVTADDHQAAQAAIASSPPLLDDHAASTLTPEPVATPAAAPLQQGGDELSEYQQQILSEFYSAVGLIPYQARTVFDARTLLEISDWDLENAVMTYVTSADTIGLLCPPLAQAASEAPGSPAIPDLTLQSPPPLPAETMISCGHVSENLSSTALQDIHEGLQAIRNGLMVPTNINEAEGVVEYSVSEGQFVLCFPLDAKWE